MQMLSPSHEWNAPIFCRALTLGLMSVIVELAVLPARGEIIVYQVTGSFRHLGSQGPDILGLADSFFELEILHDSLALPSSSSGSAESGASVYLSPTANLRVTGSSNANGTYSAACTTTVWNNWMHTRDAIGFVLSDLEIASYSGKLSVFAELPASLYTGPPPILLPTFQESEVLNATGDLYLYENGVSCAKYQLKQNTCSGQFATNSSVPEPTTFAIWGTLGGLGLIVARRRRKLA